MGRRGKPVQTQKSPAGLAAGGAFKRVFVGV